MEILFNIIHIFPRRKRFYGVGRFWARKMSKNPEIRRF
ncbi:hypothetical protein A11S_1662 [Micavibrio aeruginosavorus EPB]|uniref:Uncharacterized protein n=1 Tax=Micavibrio aeruginosavorus EPB TaxID=349215 RepID=M4VK82_9BACT|nr:hypothetical protein A11S_1662 [Micavibrio aeruginosavorus EPB]